MNSFTTFTIVYNQHLFIRCNRNMALEKFYSRTYVVSYNACYVTIVPITERFVPTLQMCQYCISLALFLTGVHKVRENVCLPQILTGRNRYIYFPM